jgi:hypothetical protein
MLREELHAEELLSGHRIDHQLEAGTAEALQHALPALQVARLGFGERGGRGCRRGHATGRHKVRAEGRHREPDQEASSHQNPPFVVV